MYNQIMNEEFKFKNELYPLSFLKNRIKNVVYAGKTYDGLILNYNSNKSQLVELLELFVQTLQESLNVFNFSKISYERIASNNSHFNKIVVISGEKVLMQFLVEQRGLIVPSLENLIDWNDKAQTIYPETGVYGLLGLKSKEDAGSLQYTLETIRNSVVFGEDQLPTIGTKAAYLWQRVAGTQAFKNGNKRTAMLAVLIMLHSNGYNFRYKTGLKQELVDMSLKIANKEIDIPAIREYILRNIVLGLHNPEWNTIERLADEKVQSDQWKGGYHDY